jgi:nitrite reductase/ring-hydroxylating ferredoxin subunit
MSLLVNGNLPGGGIEDVARLYRVGSNDLLMALGVLGFEEMEKLREAAAAAVPKEVAADLGALAGADLAGLAKPVWDEATCRFWCKTRVNAYDLPDGDDWKQEFREALERHTPAAVERVGVVPRSPAATKIVEGAAGKDAVGLAEEAEPLTPKARRPASPRTPPTKTPPTIAYMSPDIMSATKTEMPSSEKRVARAAHTKALMGMGQRAGVTEVVNGREIAFFRFGGRVFATGARCPHQGGSLCDGEIGDIEDHASGRQCYVTCPVHKMQFDLSTGRVLRGDCGTLSTYDVRISSVDERRKVALIEVGFESLADSYFSDFY